MGDPRPFEVFLLGSPRVTGGGQPLTVARRQVRALLYRLAASLQPVTREELYALLWPEKSDAVARRNLSRLLVYLRQAFPNSDLVIVTPETVALDHGRVWCDFTILLRTDLQDAEEALEAAVSLVGGRFLEGFYLPHNLLYDDWLYLTQQRIEQKHQELLDELISRKIAARSYESAIHYARQSLEIDSLDETRHRQLINLYAASGDRRAAQRQYEACVAIMERELGVQPLPETRIAYESALDEQPVAAKPYPAPRWATLPSLDLPLAGREIAWAQLEQARRRLQTGGMIWIQGEAGIGKTRLMQDFAQQSQAMVLTGNAYESTQAIPFAPLLSALRPVLEQPEWLSQVPENWLREAQILLPELRSTFPSLPQPIPIEGEIAQGRQFEALVQVFLGLSKQTPLWLYLDDLHWADENTLAWLGYLIARLRGSQVMVIVASRTSLESVLDQVLKELRRSGSFAEIVLDILDAQAVDQLLLSLPITIYFSGLAEQLLHASGGNPFYILEILRTLLESEQIQQPPQRLPLPSSVREVITARLKLVSPLAIQILEAAVILETDLSPQILQAVSGRQESEVFEGLKELVDHQIIRTDGKSIQFQHDLVRMTVLEGLHFWRQQALHRRTAEALSKDVKSHPAQIAQHWEAAESWVEAAKSYQNACQHFADQYAYLAALTQAERGLAVLQNVPDAASLRLPLLVMRMQLHQVLMKMEDWQADLEVCGELAAALDDEIAQLQILESRLSMLALQSDLPNLEKVAEKALVLAQKNGMQKAEASIRNIWGWHLSDVAGRPFDGLPHLEQAVDLARQIENLTLLYRSLCNLAFCQRTLGCCGDALSSARQALTLLPTSDEPHPAQADALREIAEAAGYLARWQEARHAMRQVVQLYEEIGDPWALGTALYNWGLFTSAMGQHTEAIAAMERLVQLGIEVSLPPDSEYGIIHRTGWAKALLDSGDLAGAEEIYRSLKLPATITGRARVDYANLGGAIALSKGDADSAMRILGPIVAEFQGTQVPHFMWTLLLHARAAHRAGDSQKALKSLAAAEKAFRQGDCIRLGRSLYFARYQITGDAEALTAAYSELQRQMDIFTDSDLRADFLEQVILNREILAAWKKKE